MHNSGGLARCGESPGLRFKLTGVAVVEESGGTAAAGQEGQRRRHEPLHDPALPRAETQAAG